MHDEPEYVNFADSDPTRNLAAQIRIDIGDVEQGFAEAISSSKAIMKSPKCSRRISSRMWWSPIGMKMTAW